MKEKYLRLTDQIIEQAEKDDLRLKDYWLLKNKACRSEGDGFVLFHLRALREMIENDNDS
jgi:hypothetical protein